MHRIRYKVSPSRKNLPHGTHLGRHVLDTVDDPVILITENDVAVFAHDLNDKFFTAEISKLIQMLDSKHDNPLKRRLCDGHDSSVCNMFSEKHTEIRGCKRAWFVFVCQIHKRQGSAR